ncbi:hypothetical protein J6590_054530 [Homalodisca vitripennis]|nr:hypothetical protein J6590_054530 [Homalodisca vitripennis]
MFSDSVARPWFLIVSIFTVTFTHFMLSRRHDYPRLVVDCSHSYLAEERYDEARQKLSSVVCRRGIRGSSPDYVVSSLQTRDTRKLTRLCGQ